MSCKIGNELQFVNEKEEHRSKAHELLAVAKEIERNRNLIHYRLNANTVLLVTPGRRMVLERDRKLAEQEKRLKTQNQPSNEN